MEKKKKPGIEFEEQDIRDLRVPKQVSWKTSTHTMTEEEVEKFRNMNWEWYYNCYVLIDEITPISCKRCAHINVFQPGEKERKCENCGEEVRRCEKEEEP